MPPNMVPAVLADYRAFATLGETAVIFTGGLAVLMLLGGRRKKLQGEPDEPAPNDAVNITASGVNGESLSGKVQGRTEA